MSEPETDLSGYALLLAVVEREGGDLRAAFAVLCSCVSPDDLTGEPFERALGRAVGTLFANPGYALAGIARPASERDTREGR